MPDITSKISTLYTWYHDKISLRFINGLKLLNVLNNMGVYDKTYDYD